MSDGAYVSTTTLAVDLPRAAKSEDAVDMRALPVTVPTPLHDPTLLGVLYVLCPNTRVHQSIPGIFRYDVKRDGTSRAETNLMLFRSLCDAIYENLTQ